MRTVAHAALAVHQLFYATITALSWFADDALAVPMTSFEGRRRAFLSRVMHGESGMGDGPHRTPPWPRVRKCPDSTSSEPSYQAQKVLFPEL